MCVRFLASCLGRLGLISSKLPYIIYHRYSLGNYCGVYLKKQFNIPLICEYNGSLIWASENWANKKLFHKTLLNSIELLNLQAADMIVTVSNPLKDELCKRGIEKHKILVNPNGVNPEQYSPDRFDFCTGTLLPNEGC